MIKLFFVFHQQWRVGYIILHRKPNVDMNKSYSSKINSIDKKKIFDDKPDFEESWKPKDISKNFWKESDKTPHIGHKDEAPDWIIDNEYILTGYRINFNSIGLTLKSLFMCHNESTNIWSHLLGVIMFICFILYIIFFVGGMTLTKPLDIVIDKFDIKSPDKCPLYLDICSNCFKKWQTDVENKNPGIFSDKDSDQLKYIRDSNLYDSADKYLHDIIQR